VFFGTKVAGHDAIGHQGVTTTFFSDLQIFPEQGVGVFVSRDGIGDLREIPDPTRAIAARLRPRAPEAAGTYTSPSTSNADVAGIYQTSRRAESSVVRLNTLVSQIVLKIDGAGKVTRFSAIWPFGGGAPWKSVGRNLYEAGRERLAFVDDVGTESYLVEPAIRLQRVPWSIDVRWIAPAFVASAAVALLTLLAWPVAALWRHVRKKRWSEDGGARRKYLVVRLVLLADAVVIAAIAVLFTMGTVDLTILNGTLDPLLLMLYALAWFGVFGAIVALWAATTFCRNNIGSRWSRVHHSMIAASSVMIAWFFVTFHIAGTTVNY